MMRILLLIVLLSTICAAVTPLTNGVGVPGNVEVGEFAYFSFETPANNHDDVTFRVVPNDFGSDPDIYLAGGKLPNLTSHQRSSTWHGMDIIKVKHTDKIFCKYPPCVWYVGIYGFRTSNFTVMATTSIISTPMKVGVPVRDLCDENGEYQYYVGQLNFHQLPKSDVHITLTEISGASIVYASTVSHRPNATDHMWVSAPIYGQINGTITISANDPRLAACGTYCELYISVLGVWAGEYTLLLSVTSVPSILLDGVPQIGVAIPHGFTYFNITTSPAYSGDIQIDLKPFWGDSNLYARVNALPTTDKFDWSATRYGSDSLTIAHTSDKYCHGGCTYVIGVFATEAIASHFRIVAMTTNATILLTVNEKQSVTYLLASEWEYYRINVPRDDVNVTIAVEPTYGETDVYVSTLVKHPDANHNDWYAVGAGVAHQHTDAVTIAYNDPKSCKERIPNCWYYIGVYAVTDANYTITATYTYVPTPLTVGEPVVAHVEKGLWKYYKLDVGTVHHDITFFVAPESTWGSHTMDPDLYVDNRGVMKGQSMWHSGYRGGDTITIRRNVTEHFCDHCTYYIGVYGYSHSMFRLVATLDDAMIEMSVGMPQRGYIDTVDGYEYFKSMVFQPKKHNLTVAVTSLSGAMSGDIYVSLTPRPYAMNYTWSGTGFMDIPYYDFIKLCPDKCWVYLSVRAPVTPFAYTVLLGGDTVPVLLTDGLPQGGAVDRRKMVYYKIPVAKSTGSEDDPWWFVNLESEYGDPDLYASTGALCCDSKGHSLPAPRPGIHNGQYTWRSDSAGSDRLILRPNTSPTLCAVHGGCWLSFGVYGFKHSHYTILAYSGDRIVTITPGTPFSDTIDAGKTRYLQVDVPHQPVNVTFTLTILQGDATLMVSKHQYPNATTSHWIATGGQTEVYIPSTDHHACHSTTSLCRYFMAVHGTSTTLQYSIVVSLDYEPIMLSDGHKQSGQAAPHGYEFFKFTVGDLSKHSDITLQVIAHAGNVDLYVNHADHGLPHKDTAQWSSALLWGVDKVTFEHGKPGWCTGKNCVYLIGVYNPDPNLIRTFGVLASTNRVPVPLTAGIASYDEVGVNEYGYFTYTLFDVSTYDLDITVTFQSDVDLNRNHVYLSMDPNTNKCPCASSHVNNATTHPTASQYWRSGSTSMVVKAADIGSCQDCLFHIGVFGSASVPSAFSIMATDKGSSHLHSGQSQTATESSFYDFYTESSNGLLITLSDVVGKALIYVSTKDKYPTADTAMWTGYPTGSLSNDVTLPIAPGTTGYCSKCYYYVQVHVTSSPTSSRYTVTAVDGTESSMVLRDGVKQSSSLMKKGQYARYEVIVTNATSHLKMHAEVCSGEGIDMYVSRTQVAPSATTPDTTKISSIHGVAELEEVGVRGNYFLGVTPSSADSIFEVVFHTNTVSTPIPGKSGVVTVTAVKDNQVALSWAAVQSMAVEYRVYYSTTDKQGLIMNTLCGVNKYGKFATVTSTTATTVTGLLSGTTYDFTVIAFSTADGTPALYSPSAATTSGKQSPSPSPQPIPGPSIVPWWAYLLGGFGACACLFVPTGYFVMKARQRKRATIELSSVQNSEAAASLVYSAYDRKKKYARLDDGDTGHTGEYDPPAV